MSVQVVHIFYHLVLGSILLDWALNQCGFNQWFVLWMVANAVDNLTEDCTNIKVWYQTSGWNCLKHYEHSFHY